MLRKTFEIFLCILMLTALPAKAAETVDRILVVVNDEIITESDLKNALTPVMTQYKATLTGQELEEKLAEISKVFLDRLIDDHLIVSAARLEEYVTVEDSEVDEMVQGFRSKFPNEAVYQRVLREQRISSKRLREKFLDEILKRKMIDYKVRARISVSPGDVLEYFQNHPEEFLEPGRAKVRHLLIRVGDQYSDEEAVELSHDIYKKVMAGGDFAPLAKAYSGAANAESGGDMGWIERGRFREDIDDAIFGLDVGESTPPIHSQLGYHLFHMEARAEPTQKSLDEVQNEIEKTIYKKRTSELMNEYLASLRKDAYISYQ